MACISTFQPIDGYAFMESLKTLVLVLFLTAFGPSVVAAPTMIVSHDYGNLDLSLHPTAEYEVALLTLFLDKTIADFGPYILRGLTKGHMTHKRALHLLASNRENNFVKSFGYNPHNIEKFNVDVVRFPIYLGALNYRTCFTSEELAPDVNTIRSYADLSLYTIATGIGWSDTDILRANRIRVTEIANRDAIYKMVSVGRVDLYCRGANEAFEERAKNSHVTGISYNTTWALYYPNPHFFHSSVQNQNLISRLEIGAKRAYADGSVLALWNKTFEKSVSYVGLKQRSLVRLENPFLEGIPFEYRHFMLTLEQ